MSEPLPGSILDRLEKIEHAQKVDQITLYDLCGRVDAVRGAQAAQKTQPPEATGQHPYWFHLDKYDRCRRCDKPIEENQPFHLNHDHCDDPLETSLT